MKKFLLVLVLLCSIKSSFGCGNEYGYSLDGQRIHTRYFFLSERMLHFNKGDINKRLTALNNKIKNGTDDYKTWSNIALNLMKLGQADSSLKILLPLYKEHPNEYTIIGNIGTAYELTGQLDSALYYISKGFEINPKSHLKSEWVHVAILEAKIQESRRSGWLGHNSVLDLDNLIKRVGKGDLRGRKVTSINNQIFLQIRTRAPFTPVPNMILANILETLGDFNRKVGTYENAILAYAYAMRFEGEKDHSKIENKVKKLNKERMDSDDIMEIPVTFQRMLKRSKMSPDLLLLGLDDFAEGQDMFQKEFIVKNDSIKLLSLQIDSLVDNFNLQIEAGIKENEHKIESIEKENKFNIIFYLGFGFLVGGILFFILGRRKKLN